MKKLLVDGFTTKIACPTGSFPVLVYPSGVDVSIANPSACRARFAFRLPGALAVGILKTAISA